MASFRKVLLQPNNPVVLVKRFRGKINIQKPRAPHFERQLLLDLSRPFYRPKEHIPEINLCNKDQSKFKKVEIDNPFERILANECLNWFNTSKMVVFVHMNSMSMEDNLPIYAALKRSNMNMRKYGKKIVQMATTGTRYEAVNQLFVSHQNIIFGQPDDVKKMFKILKRAPQIIVMAGIIEDRLLSKNELLEYSKMPNLQTAQSQLCGVLQSAASNLVSQLQQSQQTLVSHLDAHCKVNSGGPNEGENVEK